MINSICGTNYVNNHAVSNTIVKDNYCKDEASIQNTPSIQEATPLLPLTPKLYIPLLTGILHRNFHLLTRHLSISFLSHSALQEVLKTMFPKMMKQFITT